MMRRILATKLISYSFLMMPYLHLPQLEIYVPNHKPRVLFICDKKQRKKLSQQYHILNGC